MDEERDLSHLSYKELQALAHTYRVPGNIKKHLLVRTLQAIQSGNELEVGRMLVEVQQTRKKRVKKQKLNPINASSTPIPHSPNYAFPNECYYSRPPPYQWVGAEEEIAIRDEEAMKFPNYTEFQQFLLHHIQRDPYRSYRTFNENEMGQTPSIVDLRMGSGSSVLGPINADLNPVKPDIQTSNSYIPSQVELQVLEEPDDNQSRPELLKKLLEAPAGANLGEIASPDTSAPRIWSLDQYPNKNNNPLDDSDTLTADSEIESDKVWENNNTMNNYTSTNAQKNTYDSDLINGNGEIVGQLRNFEDQEMQHCSYGFQAIQSNCEKWIASNNFLTRDANSCEQVNSRTYGSVYYENNDNEVKPYYRDRKYSYFETNETENYEENQLIMPQERFAWSEGQSFQTPRVTADEGFYSQPIVDSNREYASQETNDFQGIQNSGHTELQAPHTHFVNDIYCKEDAFNHRENNNETRYNSAYYSQYYHDNNQILANFPRPIDSNQRQGNENIQPVSNGVLDPFWPRWPMNGTPTSNGQLETILNLRNVNRSLDSSKMNETSSVYCYTEPIVTQRVEGGEGWTARNKPQAENRQHLFTSNVVVYNDASTGLVMANASEFSNALDPKSQEESQDEIPIENERDYELNVSEDSSQSSINDVWIHDYTNYPVSSDNALQSADLTNDENEDDIFSAVRDTSGNTIDDHAIETFTDMNY